MKKLYILALTALLAGSAVAQSTLTQADFTGVIVPQYMGSGTTTRLPVAYRATVSNLTPNSTYKFRTHLGAAADLGGTGQGAGNPLYVNDASATYYTSAPNFQPGRSGSFTTDAAGTYTGWFASVNTGNARFTAGNDVFPVIALNGGTAAASDTIIVKRLAMDLTIKVLGFATTSGTNDGTGIWGASQAPAKSFVALYDNEAGSGRPLAITPVQSLGVVIASTVAFYTNNVAGTNGAWGTIIPNNTTGVKRIASFDIITGAELGSNSSSTGIWGATNTVSPTGGNTTPLAISATDAPLVTSLLKRMAKPMLSVSPNPSSNIIQVKGLAFGETVEVLDILGSKQAVHASANGVFNISSLKTGAYFISTSKGKVARFVKVD